MATRRDQVRVVSWVREAREHAGLSAAELARRAGMSREGLTFIENGTCSPTVGTALLLARELGTTVEQLFRIDNGGPLPVAFPDDDPQVREMADLYLTGATLDEVGKAFGTTGNTVGRKLSRAGVQIRRGRSARASQATPQPGGAP